MMAAVYFVDLMGNSDSETEKKSDNWSEKKLRAVNMPIK